LTRLNWQGKRKGSSFLPLVAFVRSDYLQGCRRAGWLVGQVDHRRRQGGTHQARRLRTGGLKKLGGKKGLHQLGLGYTKITDAGLKELARLTTLQWLDLNGTTVTDAGLKDLSELKNLRRLSLDVTALTDEGLKHLAELSQWQHLCVEKPGLPTRRLLLRNRYAPAERPILYAKKNCRASPHGRLSVTTLCRRACKGRPPLPAIPGPCAFSQFTPLRKGSRSFLLYAGPFPFAARQGLSQQSSPRSARTCRLVAGLLLLFGSRGRKRVGEDKVKLAALLQETTHGYNKAVVSLHPLCRALCVSLHDRLPMHGSCQGRIQ
jgi:hypothetical protein